MQPDPSLPAPPGVEHCYRHPGEETRVHCTRCGRPICPQCMIPAPVGYQCPDCVAEARREFKAGPGKRLRWMGLSPTRILIGVLVLIYVLAASASGPGRLMNGPTPSQMSRFGGADPLRIAFFAQYWRFITSMFLHYGLLHLAFNCYALWLLGTHAERDFGPWRFIVVYLVTGIAGGAASYAFGLGVGAGASGAIFGVMGAFLAFNYARRNTRIARMNVQWVWQILILNAFIAFGVSTIDWHAHAGGFVAGVLIGSLLDRARNLSRAAQVGGVALLLILSFASIAWRTSDLRSTYSQAQVIHFYDQQGG